MPQDKALILSCSDHVFGLYRTWSGYIALHSQQTVILIKAGFTKGFSEIWQRNFSRERGARFTSEGAYISVCDWVSKRSNEVIVKKYRPNCLRLYGQVIKRIWWMPRRQEAMKDVVACEKLRGVGKHTLIRRCPNGETHCVSSIFSWIHRLLKLTQGTETSKYLEEKKSKEIALVVASERATA